MADGTRAARGMYWDRAWSLVEGCSRYSPGCNRCWSAAQTHIRSHQGNPKIVARYGGLTDQFGRFNGTVRFMPDSLALPLRTRKPTTWSLWNDLFHKKVTDEQIAAAFGVMAATPQHHYLVLTKRAERMQKWFEWIAQQARALPAQVGVAVPAGTTAEGSACVMLAGETTLGTDRFVRACCATPWPLRNVALGVTVENQASANERLPRLVRAPAMVRFISLEPLLKPVDFSIYLYQGVDEAVPGDLDHDAVRWVVVGAETGHGRRPCDPASIRSAVEQCRTAHVPIWVKAVDLGKRVSHDPSEWPADLRVRELPWAA